MLDFVPGMLLPADVQSRANPNWGRTACMNGITSAAPPAIAPASRGMNWFPVAVLLVWVELASRASGVVGQSTICGWTVLSSRLTSSFGATKAPEPSPPGQRVPLGLLAILATAFFLPIRLIQEANPDWRLLSWAMSLRQ